MMISWSLGVGMTGFNVYYLSTAFVGWQIHNKFPKVATVFIGIMVFPLTLMYILSVRNTGRFVLYFIMRKYTSVSYIGGLSVQYK